MATTPGAFAPSTQAALRTTHRGLASWSHTYSHLHLDLGSGDGRFAVQLAKSAPGWAVLGLDTCLDHVRVTPRRLPANVRFVSADALAFALPAGVKADAITINFPYGSLLREQIAGSDGFLCRLDRSLAPGGRLDIRVNAQALVAIGLDPEASHLALVTTLHAMPNVRITVRQLSQAELRTFPSSWAKRIGYGRPTTAHWISAVRMPG